MNISVAMIGSGSMGRWHTYAYDRLNEFYGKEFQIHKKVICSPHLDGLIEKNSKLLWQECVTDWRDVVCRPDIDMIDISTPDYLHYDIAKAAIENGKHVICEKPLVFSAEEAEELCKLTAHKGVSTATMFNYRYFPASTLMRKLLDDGMIGEIVHSNGSFIMDWAVNPDVPMFWRLDDNCCPLGVLGDLGSHLIDLSRFLGLEFASVSGASSTVVKERKCDNGATAPVTIDDVTVFTAAFENGAVGSYEASRVSGGRGRGGFVFEIHGTKGNIKYEKANFDEVLLSIGSAYGENGGYRSYHIHDLLKAAYPWSTSGEFVQSDSFTLLLYDFLQSIQGNKPVHPTFYDGYETCRVVSAVKRSIKDKMIVEL